MTAVTINLRIIHDNPSHIRTIKNFLNLIKDTKGNRSDSLKRKRSPSLTL